MRYQERLRPPASYWLVGLAFGLSFVTAIGAYYGAAATLVSAALAAGLVAGVLVGMGGLTIDVSEAGLRVGRNLLEWEYLGEVTVLDETSTKARLGPRADARDFLLTRPYVSTAVEVRVTDPADPHPFWLVSTRRPAAVAAAVTKARPAGPRLVAPAP